MNKQFSYLIPSIAIVCLLIASCIKVPADGPLLEIDLDNAAQIDVRVQGQILQDDGTPLAGAIVRLGTQETISESNGYFQLIDVAVAKNKAVVHVEANGFFRALRLLSAEDKKMTSVKIKMYALPMAQTFQSSVGGTVNITGGGSLSVPPNILVNKETGDAYSGEVKAFGQWIDPTDPELPIRLPGSLMARTSSNAERVLQSFGMHIIVLEDPMGNALDIGDGFSADLQFPIPASLNSSAPQSIPSWILDEESGVWTERETAVNPGSVFNVPIGDIGFWNCDMPFERVGFSSIFVDENNQPMQEGMCVLTFSNGTMSRSQQTDKNGRVAGQIPANETLELEFYSGDCQLLDVPSYTTTFTTTSAAKNLGEIKVIPPSSSTKLIGRTVNCLNEAISEAPVIVEFEDQSILFATSDDEGYFSVPLFCKGNQDLKIVVYDLDNSQRGESLYEMTPGTENYVGHITACGNLTEFVSWTSSAAGTTQNAIIEKGNMQGNILQSFQQGRTYITANDSSAQKGVYFHIDGVQHVNADHLLSSYTDHFAGWGGHQITANPEVQITKYEEIGGFIEGTYESKVTSGTNPVRTVKCSFRVKRVQ